MGRQPSAAGAQSAAAARLDVAVGRLLRIGILIAVAILAVAVALMTVDGRSPLDKPFPPLDIGAIPSQVAALRPEGFLWLGLIAVILTPISRVAASLLGYIRTADRPMIFFSVAILGVIGLSVIIGIAVQ